MNIPDPGSRKSPLPRVVDTPETFWAYLAGFFDGEGCITRISKSSWRIDLYQKDSSILEAICLELGYGRVAVKNIMAGYHPCQMHMIQFYGRNARAVALGMLPYSLHGDKKLKLELLLESNTGSGKGSGQK